MVILHITALHIHGSSNATGIEVKTKKDTVPFHPYYTVKDFFGFGVYFLIFTFFVFYMPNSLGHPDNYIPADPLVTPAHIVPEWYFLPFYAILRSIPDKLGGVIAMFASILIWFVLPWLDTLKTRSGHYRPMFKWFYGIFIINFFILGYIGQSPTDEPYLTIGRITTLYYFAYFLVILPVLNKVEKTLDQPSSIYASCTNKGNHSKQKGKTDE